MRLKLDFERLRDATRVNLPGGVEAARSFKKNVLGGYVRALERIDPQVAANILGAQREFFAAGKAFFEAEMNHAARAEEKFRAKVVHPTVVPVTTD